MRNQLFQIKDKDGTFWVSAPTKDRAMMLVQTELGDMTDVWALHAPEVRVVDEAWGRKMLYHFENGETCSLWNAFEIIQWHEDLLAATERGKGTE